MQGGVRRHCDRKVGGCSGRGYLGIPGFRFAHGYQSATIVTSVLEHRSSVPLFTHSRANSQGPFFFAIWKFLHFCNTEGGFTIRRRASRCDALRYVATSCVIVNIARRLHRVALRRNAEERMNRTGFYSSVVTRDTTEQSTNEIAACDMHVSSIAIGMEEEKLIEAVRALPCVWQVNSKSYRDQMARENTWKQVAEAVRELKCRE